MDIPNLATLDLTVNGGIASVALNRPDKANALNLEAWFDLRRAFDWADAEPTVRVAVLSGHGKHFCSGIDIAMLAGIADQVDDDCEGRKREKLRRVILDLQDTLTSLERCRKPVIAAVHGACVGGGIDLICAADLRLASADARFSIKEIDMGMTADVGTLQRMPKWMAPGIVRELAFTGRDFTAAEAHQWDFVNRVCADREALAADAQALAAQVAAKSPLAIRGIKEQLNYARDHSVADGLNYVATWNAALLMSSDLNEAMMAAMQRQPAKFRD
ncbi:MAG: crotonase/enoyl-CoA hydratase family protein [Betaproteobacteria bacterium]|nr:crotonase/enoyl-CoA hydratase family protein [Betaproteobacteria bacterium]